MVSMRQPRKKAPPRRRRSKQSEWLTAPINVGILPNLLGYSIRRAQIALWRDFGRTVGEGTVRPGMFSLLVLVEANPGIAQVDLARVLDQDKATIVGLIDSLQRRRWVVRRKSSVDARRHGIFLTAAGKAGLEELRHEMLEHEQRFTRLFSNDEMTTLITLLRRIHP
jgi:DNA-binding MarR family transcriptional regulator